MKLQKDQEVKKTLYSSQQKEKKIKQISIFQTEILE